MNPHLCQKRKGGPATSGGPGTVSVTNPTFVYNTWKEGRISERCAKCGMIFTILSQDCNDEVTARQRLYSALKEHGGCERTEGKIWEKI